MERYIGMDVHAASCTLAVISEKGRKLRDFPVETNGQALVEAVRMIPGHKHLVLEEGLQSAWLYETLSPHVDELVVAGITQSRGHEERQARRLWPGREASCGKPRQAGLQGTAPVHTPARVLADPHDAGWRRGAGAVSDQEPLPLPRHPGLRRERLRRSSPREWQQRLCSSAQARAARLYDHLDFLLEQKKQAEADLLREAKKHPIVRVLETAPGFGPIRAARLVPIVVTPHRFRTKRQFWSYCGLGIVTRSSSDWVQAADGGWIKARVPQTRGLSRQHNHVLKDIFKGAATTVITQCNKDPIYARYERLLDGGTKPTLAKLSLARMIAATVLRMWKDEKEYDPETGRIHRQLTREG